MTSLKDIAQELGLSVSVVSRALNPNPDANARIAPHTLRLISETAARMGYRRNHAAEFMRRKRSAAIGVFVPEFSNRLIADLILGLHEEANRAGFSLQLHSGLDAASYRSFLADHNSLASTGIISYSPRQYHFPEQEEIEGVSLVFKKYIYVCVCLCCHLESFGASLHSRSNVRFFHLQFVTKIPLNIVTNMIKTIPFRSCHTLEFLADTINLYKI